LTDKDIDDLVKWGINFVRLGVMWEAVERAPGVYDDAYLDKVDELITKLGERGIYTLVDAHQDVLARVICGEGMPNFYAKDIISKGAYCFGKYEDWLLAPLLKLGGACVPMDNYGYRKDEDGNPLIEDCQKVGFFMYYSSPEAFTLFRGFYNNDFGIQDKYLEYWSYVSNRLSSNKFVIGYDPINEPGP
jgi:endoglycosylceramidase